MLRHPASHLVVAVRRRRGLSDWRRPHLPHRRAVTNTSWLKSMEHGALGEARAKAFLMNRFWVLERSVDVHGADFIIQLNSLRVNLLDSKPPRFGVIQVKFVQDGDTKISVPVPYTQDEAGNPAGEFFLIVCTGRDDDERLFLLSAAEISALFTRRTDAVRDVYESRANQILRDSNFEVVSRSLGLKRIEAALTRADVLQNKRYLRHLSAGSPASREHIDADYLLPLINNVGDIPDGILEQKRSALKLLQEMENVAEALAQIVDSTDPVEINRLVDTVVDDKRNNTGMIVFSGHGVGDYDLAQAVESHAAHLDLIRRSGIAGAYFNLIERVDKAARLFARQSEGVKHLAVHLTVSYTPGTLTEVHVRFTAEDALCESGVWKPEDQLFVVASSPGEKSLCFARGWAMSLGKWYDPTRDSRLVRRPLLLLLDQELFGTNSDLY